MADDREFTGEFIGEFEARLDTDDDGQPDVLVPGLGDPHLDHVYGGRGHTEAYEAEVDADLPPTSSPYSPMGQIEHMGYALRSRTARTGWRWVVIRVTAWLILGGFVIAVIGQLITAR
jgi:hypothetical protein